MTPRQITPTVSIADQPSEAELRALKGWGFAGVVNLRHDGEPEQPLGTVVEGELVRGLGLDYLHYAVGPAPLTEAGVESVCKFLDDHAGQAGAGPLPQGGPGRGALVLIHQALAEKWSPAEAAAKGKALGPGGRRPPLRAKVEAYLHDHQANP